MAAAGSLRERLQFQSPKPVSDRYGNEVSGWTDEFQYSTDVKPMSGGETVLASRLSGVQPVNLRVRYSSDTRRITAAWRAVDAHTGTIYQMKGPPADKTGKRAYLDIVAEIGVAA